MEKEKFDYVCIFTGGSIRGAAYVGALRAMEELNIKNVCYVGSSVGSVLGVFYAVGYSPNELETIINNINFDLFKDINFTFRKDFSISKGEYFLEWLRENIEQKFYKDKYEKGKMPHVTFKDIETDIVILTTDIYSTKVKIFSKKETPDFEIAEAVRISSSMPGLMKPVIYENKVLVDGDLSRSWPIWKIVPGLFDYNTRILEFRLEGGKERDNINNTADFLNSVYTAFSNFAADNIIQSYQNKDKFDYIRLDAGNVNITDFNLSQEGRKNLYKTGYETTYKFFKEELPQKRARILPHYKTILEKLLEVRKNIETSKYIIAKNHFAELFVTLSKARKVIDAVFYDKLLSLYEKYLDNLTQMAGIFTKLKNKKEILEETNTIIDELRSKTIELEAVAGKV